VHHRDRPGQLLGRGHAAFLGEGEQAVAVLDRGEHQTVTCSRSAGSPSNQPAPLDEVAADIKQLVASSSRSASALPATTPRFNGSGLRRLMRPSRLELPEEAAVTGWRMWFVRDGRLVPPVVTGTRKPRIPKGAPGAQWAPFVNTSRHDGCQTSGKVGTHPTSAGRCDCGIRLVQSRRHLDLYAELIGNQKALALVAAPSAGTTA